MEPLTNSEKECLIKIWIRILSVVNLTMFLGILFVFNNTYIEYVTIGLLLVLVPLVILGYVKRLPKSEICLKFLRSYFRVMIVGASIGLVIGLIMVYYYVKEYGFIDIMKL